MLSIYLEGKHSIIVVVLVIFINSFSVAKESNMNIPKIWNIQNYSYNFEGRIEEINKITNFMLPSHNIIAIVGPGGIGKTQLAKKIAEITKQHYEIVWWFDAKKDLDFQMKELATHWNDYIVEDKKKFIDTKNLSLKQILEKLKNNLRAANLNFLLIFDDVDTANEIREYIPIFHNESKSDIIITSRNVYVWDNVIKLKPFNRNESIALLMRTLNNITIEEANKLADILYDYPLSLSQGASYIKLHSSVSIDEYVDSLQKKLSNLWKEEEKMKKNINQQINNSINEYPHTVEKAINISIDEVRTQSELAYKLLILSAFLNNKDIPEEFFFRYKGKNSESIHEAISVLEQHSIIDKNTFSNVGVPRKDTYTMHEIIQNVILTNLTINEFKESLQEAIEMILIIMPNKIDFLVTFIKESPFYLNHLEKLKTNCSKAKIYNSKTMELNQRILEYYLPGERNFEKAELLIKDMEFIKSNSENLDIPLLLRFDSIKSALLEWRYYNVKGAIEELNNASRIALNLKQFPEERLMVFNRLVQLYIQTGDIENAEKYSDISEKVIKNAKESVGNQDTFYYARARIAIDKGNIKNALYNVRNAMEKTPQLLSDNLPFTAKLPVLLLEVEILNRGGNYKLAYDKVNFIIENLSKCIKDSKHVYFARVKTQVGRSCLGLKNIAKAKQEALDSISIFQKASNYANSRPQIAALMLLADVYIAEENYLEAQSILIEIEKIVKSTYTHYKIDDVSNLYKNLAKNSLRLNDMGLVQYYVNVHKDIFGSYDKHTIELIDELNINK